MEFSHNGNLYLLYFTDNYKIIYRIKVKKDSHSRERFNKVLSLNDPSIS